MVIFCSRLSAHNPAGNPPLSVPVAFSRRKLKTLFVESWPRPWKRKRKEGEGFFLLFLTHLVSRDWIPLIPRLPTLSWTWFVDGRVFLLRFDLWIVEIERSSGRSTIFRQLLSPSFLDRKAKINLHIISLLVSRPPFLCCAKKKDKNSIVERWLEFAISEPISTRKLIRIDIATRSRFHCYTPWK